MRFGSAIKYPKTSAILQMVILFLLGGTLVYFSTSLAVDATMVAMQILGGVLGVATLIGFVFLCHKLTFPWRYFVASLMALSLIGFINIIVRNIENIRLDAESVVLKTDLTTGFNVEAKVSDFLEVLQGSLVEDAIIPTDELGTVEVDFDYINQKGRKRHKSFAIEVVDRTAPLIYGSTHYTVYQDYTGDLTDLMLSGDDLDDQPKREILGEYDLSAVGDYILKYAITDASGNSTTQEFTLSVIEPPQNTSENSTTTGADRLPIGEVISQHKSEQTKIGIDVSAWQGEIDWEKVKAAGVEFAFIRIGYQVGYGGEYVMDRYFTINLAGATEVGLPVGVYFYSYADSTEEAVAQADWIVEQLDGRELELGVAFDWEDWGNFNQTNMSFRTINKVANAYLDTVTAAGYQGSLYGSKNYLTQIWQPGKYPVWLAQYYKYVTYEGDYWIWQMSDSGRVDGISGNVDLDIMYLQ